MATPPGVGGVAIVRLSGPESLRVVSACVKRAGRALPSDNWESHRLYYGKVYDGDDLIDEVMAVFMRGPHSYTGEDSAEIQCHGGRAVTEIILGLCLSNGARLARPGEFTCRAYASGRIDLAQSEYVLGLIEAGSKAEVRLNAQGLQGALSRRADAVRSALVDLAAEAEAAFDYGDEIEGLSSEDICRRCQSFLDDVNVILADAAEGKRLSQGLTAVLAGPPNAGKSTLWNALIGEDKALVTPYPGTTRDQLEASAVISGIPFNFTDTAGLRSSDDPVESLGIERARRTIASASLLLIVADISENSCDLSELAKLAEDVPAIVVLNKNDLEAKRSIEETQELFPSAVILSCSLKNDGAGLVKDALVKAARAGRTDLSSGALSVNVRQHEALISSKRHLEAVVANGCMPPDCLLIDVRKAIEALSEITGDNVSDDILERVFSKFCLGK